MLSKSFAGLAFAAACVTAICTAQVARADMTNTEVLTNGPQTDRGDRAGGWSAQRNVIESQHYDALVATSPGFRAARMRKECGPISDPQLHADCVSSFDQYEGSSAAPERPYRRHRHY